MSGNGIGIGIRPMVKSLVHQSPPYSRADIDVCPTHLERPDALDMTVDYPPLAWCKRILD
jgi:hypothetical protein